MHLYLIRHADPDYERDTLTRQGFREARALAGRMKRVGLTHVYSSPLSRALLTARPLARRVRLPIAQENWLVEPELSIVQNGDRYMLWDAFGEDVRSRDPLPTQESWDQVPPFDTLEVSEMWRGFRQHADELLARHAGRTGSESDQASGVFEGRSSHFRQRREVLCAGREPRLRGGGSSGGLFGSNSGHDERH